MSELTEAEKCKAVDVIVRDAVLLDKSKGMLIEIISAIEGTEAYKKASDPLNDEPSKEEQRLLKDVDNLKEDLQDILDDEADLQQPSGKNEVEEVL